MPAPLFDGPVLLLVVTAYLFLLLAIGTLGERRFEFLRERGLDRYVYVFAAGVYCTSWTFYGCIGNAAQTGPSFLGLFVGPSVFALCWWFFLRKLVRVCRRYNVTSVPDFLGIRYGSYRFIGPVATLLLVVGSVPYISLQLQAVAVSFNLLGGPPAGWFSVVDPMLVVSLFMGAFALIFGGRFLDFTKRQGGLLTAVAFESVVKLLIFLAAGIFVCYRVFDGAGDIFERAFANPEWRRLITLKATPGSGYSRWLAYMAIATIDVVLLPRQFHVFVVQNGDEKHIRTAMWLFPLYLLVINLFVIPIALGGLALGLPPAAGDKYILAIPMLAGDRAMSLLIFLGGFSAATAMVLVSSVALGKMVANNLLIPGLLSVRRPRHGYRHLLAAARASMLVVIALGYLYARVMSRNAALMEIGIISFVAVAQFGPAVIGGLYWRGATARGAMLGIGAGFAAWAYTLILPAMVKAGFVGPGILSAGPGGIAALRPTELLGAGFGDPVWNAVFWSLSLNLLAFVAGSWSCAPEAEESAAREIVGGGAAAGAPPTRPPVPRPAGAHYMSLDEIRDVVVRYTGQEKNEEIDAVVREIRDIRTQGNARDAVVRQMELPGRLERVLTGSIGTVAARSVLREMLPMSLAEARTLIESYREMEKDLASTKEEVSQKEAEIRARERFLASVVRSIDDGIVSFDLEGKITTVNEGAVRLFRAAEHQLIGRDFSELIRDSEYREKRRIIARSTYRTGVWRGEVDIVRKDGAVVPVLLSTAKIISPRGRPLGFVGSFKDLRELKAMQARILQSEKLATLGQMAAGVAHEIRNPLGSIKMTVRLLRDGMPPGQALEEVEQIRDAVASMEVIVNELLDYTRDIILTVDDYDLGKIVDAAVGAIRGEPRGQGVGIRVEGADPPVTAAVDGVRVKQVVTNIVRNAVEAAAQRGGTVVVRLSDSATHVRIDVRDTGPGMTPEEVAKVFQPFYTTKAQGVGLGMPIVKRLVELHGGEVEVASSAGEGTTVSVSLPRVPFGLAEGRR